MGTADQRSIEHKPVQTSAVLVLNAAKRPTVPPPSPPTPSLPTPEGVCDPPDALDLNACDGGGSGVVDDDGEKPAAAVELSSSKWISDGLHVLQTEANALHSLAHLYQTDAIARDGFRKSVEAIARQRRLGGKLVIAGVGKSGHIGKKLVATFQSLAVPAVFLHPTEALHGDLGLIGPHDAVMLITFSGKTSELLLLLPHLDEALPLIVLTAHLRSATCEILRRRTDAILLPSPIPELETSSFGVAAPTTSTTVALAVGDAVAVASANELHPSVASVFARNHPGGSIGAAFRRGRQAPRPTTTAVRVKDIISPSWTHLPTVDDEATGFDLLRAGFGSPAGWIRLGGEHVISARSIRSLGNEQLAQPARQIPGLVTERRHMVALPAGTKVEHAGALLQDMWGPGACSPNTVVSVMEDGDLIGVLEARELLGESSH